MRKLDGNQVREPDKNHHIDEDDSESKSLQETETDEQGEAVKEREKRGKPKPNRINWKTYQLTPDLETSVLDVLTEEPVFERPISVRSMILKPKIANVSVSERRGPLDSIPERFRINTSSIIKVIRQLLPTTTSSMLDELSSFTYHRPYRTLIRIEPDLREYMKKLEEIHKPKLETDQQELLSNQPSGDEPMNMPDNEEQQRVPIKEEEEGSDVDEEEGSDVDEAEEELRSKETLEDLQCLMSFVDEDLGKLLQLRKHIANRETQKISFNNIWLLFELGDEIVSPQIPSQIFKVFHTAGGRQLDRVKISSMDVEDESTKDYRRHEKFSHFVVHAYRLDYDGDRIIPIEHKFR